jgi:hypothetical protein
VGWVDEVLQVDFEEVEFEKLVGGIRAFGEAGDPTRLWGLSSSMELFLV